jgi:L-alanine-DL-glutamate epimerase-like enolase superfamily enzyme
MPVPGEWTDRPYHQDTFRLDEEGNVKAPTKAGLGFPIDRDGLDKILKRIDR